MKLLILTGLFPLFSANPLLLSNSLVLNTELGPSVREMTDTLTYGLKTLASLPPTSKAARTINKIFNENNTCLKNIDEVIEAVEQSTRLVEDASLEFLALNIQVQSLMENSGVDAEVVGQVADILRSLSPLAEKLSPALSASQACSVSTENTLAYLRSLAAMMHEFSYDQELAPTQEIRDNFYRSGNILSAVSAFLSQLQIQSQMFQNFCSPTKESTMRGIRALGNIMDSLADLFSTQGSIRIGEEIRKGKFLAERIAIQVSSMRDLNIGFTQGCTGTNLRTAASVMEKLAEVIRRVGFEKLLKFLGVDIEDISINTLESNL